MAQAVFQPHFRLPDILNYCKPHLRYEIAMSTLSVYFGLDSEPRPSRGPEMRVVAWTYDRAGVSSAAIAAVSVNGGPLQIAFLNDHGTYSGVHGEILFDGYYQFRFHCLGATAYNERPAFAEVAPAIGTAGFDRLAGQDSRGRAVLMRLAGAYNVSACDLEALLAYVQIL